VTLDRNSQDRVPVPSAFGVFSLDEGAITARSGSDVAYGIAELAEEFEAMKSHCTLSDFLLSEILFAFAFLDTAQICGSPAHAEKLVDDGRTALASVRHFMKGIEDPFESDEVRRRADLLDDTIKAFFK
jgi:hypothetical protein